MLIIDRFEGEYAVCEEERQLPKTPQGVPPRRKPGGGLPGPHLRRCLAD